MIYKGIQTIKVTHPNTEATLTIRIDFNKADTMWKIVSMVKYFDGWEKRLANNDRDYVRTYIKDVSKAIILNALDGFSTKGVKNHFKDAQGFYPMDGSHGIELISVEANLDLEHESMEIRMNH